MTTRKTALHLALVLSMSLSSAWAQEIAIEVLQAPPHDFGCRACHVVPVQPSGDPATDTGNANLCLSCHNPAGLGADTPLSMGDRATLSGAATGSSHAWDVIPENPAADALMPIDPLMAAKIKNGRMVCGTCHDQHSQSQGEPLLRTGNDGDAMCLDCHRPRRMGRWADAPQTNIGNHPVEVVFPAGNDDLHPSLKGGNHLPLKNGQVVCTTCHAPHFGYSTSSRWYEATAGGADRKSLTVANAAWTPDAFAGWELVFGGTGNNRRLRRFVDSNTADTLRWAEPASAAVATSDTFALYQTGEGDGAILRGANDDTICKNCHTYPDHPFANPQHTCRTCHVAHGTDNILLVASEIDGKALSFKSRAAADFIHGAPNYDGVCETCHTSTRYHRNNTSGDHTHNANTKCTDCHLHEKSFGGNCADCHEASPQTLKTGSHAMHFTSANGPQIEDCDACHGAGASGGGHAGHRNGVVNFGGVATQNLAATAVCDSCHSPEGFHDGVNDATLGAKPNWPTKIYDTAGNLPPAKALWCATCHDDNPATPENEASVIGGAFAPSILGDNATFGFYVTGHGKPSGNYGAESWQPDGSAGNAAAALECATCHVIGSTHVGPAAANRLRPGFTPDATNAACAQCHDPGQSGAGAPTYYTTVGNYATSPHGAFQCSSCHDVHGVASPASAMARDAEEGLCYSCHPSLEAAFQKTSHHQVDDAEQAANASRIECSNCHNPHMPIGTLPTVNPDDPTVSWSGASRDFCIACHDGNPPAAIRFPAAAPGASWDQSDYGDHPHSNPTNTCEDCHSPHGSSNLLLVNETIDGRGVEFTSRAVGGFTHGAPNYNGVCEVCHTATDYYRNNPAGDHTHNANAKCTECHSHEKAFAASCADCHEASPQTLKTGSHAMHFTSANGPRIEDCDACHGAGASGGGHAGHRNGVVNFGGVATQNLAATAVCDSCHSPEGFHDGVNDAVLGAKPNWPTKIYDAAGNLPPAKALWCATCHDDNPATPENEASVIGGQYAPSILGDNATFGFYVTGHGKPSGNYGAESWQPDGSTGNAAAALECATCHVIGSTHVGPAAGDRLRPGFTPDATNAACAQCHDPGQSGAGAPTYYTTVGNYATSPHGAFQCSSCHDVHGAASPASAMARDAEEGLCYSCHPSLEAAFQKTSHHQVNDAEQAANGSRVECSHCHNPHMPIGTLPTVNPDDPTVSWSGASRDFCIACHDGNPPAAIRFPAAAPGASWDQSGYGDHPYSNPTNTCEDCHSPHGSSNLLLVNETIDGRGVEFTSRAVGGFTHGAPNYNGVCEVCHSDTSYHQNNPAGDHSHGVDTVCTTCHLHENEFTPQCGSCHDASPDTLKTGSHASHFASLIGPGLTSCEPCHGAGASTGTHAGHLNGKVNFSGGADDTLIATGACDTCHSPLGLADGVAEAKPAWADGVYQVDGHLNPAHERWCLGCHDDNPATPQVNESAQVGGVFAPAIGGDGATYGYYVTGHGRSGTRFPAMSWQPTAANGNPPSAMVCDWCHDIQSKHIAGGSLLGERLKPGFGAEEKNAGCNQCHRPGGSAASLPTYYTDSTEYDASAHGSQLCASCHNPHGAAGPNTAMTLAKEESLCYTCHPSAQAEFMKSSHHDVDTASQTANGSRVECSMCHNPHIIKKDMPLVSPDNAVSVWTESSPRDFCLACHDATPPAAVKFPATSPGTGWDQSRFVGARHDITLGGDCTLCHTSHGGDHRSLLLANYTVADNTNASQAAYQLCFNCHDYTKTIADQNAFSSYHDKHVDGESAPCITCHNAHASRDAGEDGLIDFKYPTTHGFSFSLTANGTTYDLSTSFADTGTDRGRCSLACHGEDHDGYTYTGTRSVTVDCLQCHATYP